MIPPKERIAALRNHATMGFQRRQVKFVSAFTSFSTINNLKIRIFLDIGQIPVG
jgi:hypothetical protein